MGQHLGRLVLDPGELVAEVNSSNRANRLMREIRTRLSVGARLVDRRLLDLETELRKHRSARGAESAATTAGVAAPELQALNDGLARSGVQKRRGLVTFSAGNGGQCATAVLAAMATLAMWNL